MENLIVNPQLRENEVVNVLNKILKAIFLAGLFLMPVVFWPWAPVPYEIPKVWFFCGWVEVLGVLGVLALLRQGFGRARESSGRNILIFVLPAIFVLASVVSSVLGVDFGKSLLGNYYRGDGLLTLFHLFGLFLFLVLFWEESWERPTAWAIVAGSLAVSFWTIVLGILGRWGNFGPTFGNPNFLAGYLLVSLPFTVYGLRGRRIIGKIGIIGIIGVIIAIILTGAKAGVLGIIIFALLFLSFREKDRIKGSLLELFAVSVIFLLLWFSQADILKYTPEGRNRIIIRGVVAFTKRPIFGWGVANFDKAFESNFWPLKVKFSQDVYVDKAHGNLLEVLVTTGAVGLGIYLLVILRVVKGLIRVDKRNWGKTLLLSFLLFLFHSQTNVISINEEMFFWLIAGITVARTKVR